MADAALVKRLDSILKCFAAQCLTRVERDADCVKACLRNRFSQQCPIRLRTKTGGNAQTGHERMIRQPAEFLAQVNARA